MANTAQTEADEVVERTLHICREVNVFKIPPRPDAGGFHSGEWRIADKIFTGRLRVVSIRNAFELRLEDVSTGDLFALCPVPFGQREICIEPATDSSRYFVLRVVDATSGRHAFLGLGFDERGDAFDFSAAMSDHERHVQREQEVKEAVSSGSKVEDMPSDVAALYKSHGDLSFKDGQTIHVNVNLKSKPKQSGGFMSRHAETGKIGVLPPPQTTLAPPPLAPPPQPAPSQKTSETFSSQTSESQGWATFD